MEHATTKMGRQLLDDPDLPDHEWLIPIGVHLMRRCPKCVNAVHTAFARWARTTPDDPRVALVAFEFLYRHGVPEEKRARQAHIDADELLELEPSERKHRLADEELRFRSPALVDELLKRCEDLLTLDREGALELAELAVDISLRTDPDVVGSLAFHARARAAAHHGNCLRLRDQTRAAEEAYNRANEHYREAPYQEPEIVAELKLLEASLAIDQRRFSKAEALLDSAFEIYSDLGELRSMALTLIKQANVELYRNEPEAGLPALQRAASLIDPDEEPKLQWSIRYNQALYAVEAGKVDLAQRLFREHRHVLTSQTEPWFTVRIVWLRAKIARGKDRLIEASKHYRRVREEFLAQGLGYDAALVSLELALLHLEEGNTQAVRRLAIEMLPVLQAQDVHREAMAALVVFERAARAEELTVELTTQLLRYLQLARSDTSLRFHEFQADLPG